MFHLGAKCDAGSQKQNRKQISNYVNAEGARYFPCPRKCGRQYKYKKNLNQHLKFECGQKKQFLCHLCPKSFAHKGQLKSHLVIVHRSVVNI